MGNSPGDETDSSVIRSQTWLAILPPTRPMMDRKIIIEINSTLLTEATDILNLFQAEATAGCAGDCVRIAVQYPPIS